MSWLSAPGPGLPMKRRRLRSICRSGRCALGSRARALACGNSERTADTKWSMRLEREIPATRDLPTARLQRRKEHLVREAAASIGASERPRRRWLLGALVPAAVLLLGATGIGTYLLTREATHLESIGCYATADLGADTTIVSADGRDPVAVCAELWQDGAVGSG